MRKEEYLKKVRKALIFIDKKKREDIVREIESEINERLALGEVFEEIVNDLPDPREVRNEYLDIYGPSKFLIIVISLGIILLSLITIPVIPFTDIVFVASPITLLLLGIILVWLSGNIGRKYSVCAAVGAGIARVAVFYLTGFFIRESFEPGTDISVIVASIVIAIIPFISIRKKEEKY